MRTIISIALTVIILFLSPFVIADTDSNTVSKKQAVELALKEYSGRTLKITDQGTYYVVRILRDNGRVLDVQVDKKTGAVRKD
jgi:uncharacterized membrane protein YkoI